MSHKYWEPPARAVISSHHTQRDKELQKHSKKNRGQSPLKRRASEQPGGNELKESSWTDAMKRGISDCSCAIEGSDYEAT